jgi:outer membrane protein TolC
MKFWRFSMGVLGAAFLAGCATYKSLPIDPGSVDKALAPPSLESLKVSAMQFKHPLIAPVLVDGTGGFSPDEIAVLAVIISPEMRALRAQRGVSRAQVIQAGILPNPQLAYGYDRPSGNSDPSLVPAYSIGLSWDVSALLAHRDLVDSARAEAKSVDVSVAWQEWQTAQGARMRAFRILSLEEQRPLLLDVEAALSDSMDLKRKSVAMGHTTLPDLSAATEAWQAALDARLEVEQQLANEYAELDLQMGVPPGKRIQLKAGATFPEVPATAEEAAFLLNGLEDRRLDLIALRHGYESQESTLRAAVWAQFPKIGLNVNRARDTTPVKTEGFGVTLDIPLFDRNQGQIAIATATRQQIFDEYVARVAEARSQVVQILEELSLVHRQLRANEMALPELERMNRAFDTAMASRNADVFAARDSRGALAAKRVERSQLRQQLLELEVGLEIATGRALIDRGPNPNSNPIP